MKNFNRLSNIPLLKKLYFKDIYKKNFEILPNTIQKLYVKIKSKISMSIKK